MAYLYAALGVALIIPLMALAQTLISLASLEGEAGFLRSRRLELLNLALVNLQDGLEQAMNADPQRLRASTVDNETDEVIESFFPACSELQPADQFVGDELESVQWFGSYPHCTAVLAEFDGSRNVTRRLRVEMGVAQSQEPDFRDLPDPATESNGVWQVNREALRIRRSCWVSVATQAEECS